ncbi:MFS transporter [Acidithiobacillus sp. M4-SHS-6]|uniref:MFS transporter n=1 Tax=Acidithiobacillus sp. M4-SHS-6 TaxID=3383024 RepID=UPI0039BDDC94
MTIDSFRLNKTGKLGLTALLLAVFLGAIDSTIVSTALPVLARQFHDTRELPWIMSGFLLSSTLVMPVYGKLGDTQGRRSALLIAQCIFTLGTLLCALSPGFIWLVLFRTLQGAGAGGLLVVAMAAIGDIIPLSLRGKYQGLFGLVFAVALTLGPLAGGLLVSMNWRMVFLATIPVSILAGWFAIRYLPNPATPQKWDFRGTALLLALLTGLFLLPHLPLVGNVLVGGVCLVLAVVFAATLENQSIIPRNLFHSRTFVVSAASSLLLGGILMGTLSYIPVWLQDAQGIKPTPSGLMLLPMLAAMMTSSVLGGWWSSRKQRYKILPLMGLPITSSGLITVSLTSTDPHIWIYGFYSGTILIGMGMGLTLQTLILAAQLSAPREHLGTATSTISLVRNYGGAISVTLLGMLFTKAVASQGIVYGVSCFIHDALLMSGIALFFLTPGMFILEEMHVYTQNKG